MSSSHVAKLKKLEAPQRKPLGPSLPEWRIAAVQAFAKHVTPKHAALLDIALYNHLTAKYKNQENASVESAVFQKIYSQRVRGLIALLDENSNAFQPQLLDKLKMEGAESIVVMKPWETSPDKWAHVIDMYQKEITGLAKKAKSTSNLFTCGKCHKKETSYYEMQSRSSDEPMTTYISCINCGHQWKL